MSISTIDIDLLPCTLHFLAQLFKVLLAYSNFSSSNGNIFSNNIGRFIKILLHGIKIVPRLQFMELIQVELIQVLKFFLQPMVLLEIRTCKG